MQGTENVLTVQIILDSTGDVVPTCWDEILTDPDRSVIYNIAPTDNETWSIRSCVSGIRPAQTPRNQPDEQLDQSVVNLGVDPQPCARPYVAVALEGGCVMSLTDTQKKIVGANGPLGEIPNAVLDTLPSHRLRTNELVTFYDTALPDGSTDPRRTRTYDVEPGITMWAEMTGSYFYPYGANTTPAIPCDAIAQFGPTACQWAYPESSGGQVNAVYPTRLETDWIVRYSDNGVIRQLGGVFKKFDDVGMPVFDVQAIVVN